MRARARVVAEARGCASRLTCLRSDGPLVLRSTPGAVYLVGAAAGPVGGDDLRLEVEVGPGAELTLRTVAASVALPGPGPSRFEVVATVGEGGVLRWLPEPTVAAGDAQVVAKARVALATGSRLVWRDEIVLGRHDELGGSVSAQLSVDVGGHPLLRHRLDAGVDHPEWASPAVAGGARCAGSLVAVDPAWGGVGRRPPGPVVLGPGTGALLPLEGPAAQVVALAGEAIGLRRLLQAGQAAMALEWAEPGADRPPAARACVALQAAQDPGRAPDGHDPAR